MSPRVLGTTQEDLRKTLEKPKRKLRKSRSFLNSAFLNSIRLSARETSLHSIQISETIAGRVGQLTRETNTAGSNPDSAHSKAHTAKPAHSKAHTQRPAHSPPPSPAHRPQARTQRPRAHSPQKSSNLCGVNLLEFNKEVLEFKKVAISLTRPS